MGMETDLKKREGIESDIGVLEVLNLPADWEVVCFLGPDRTACEIRGGDLVGIDAVRVRLFEKEK